MALERLTADGADAAAHRRKLGQLLGVDLAGLAGRADAAGYATVFRLLVRGEPMTRADAASVLRPETIDAAIDAGLLDEFDVDGADFLLATACILPEQLPDGDVVWIACDLPWQDARPDHVPGPGNASRTLMRALPTDPVNTAADIGTGCGVVALYLSTFATRVIATDVSTRALAFAELTAALNGRDWDLRRGSYVDPIANDGVDLVAANPPFVIGNPDALSVFRDGHVTQAAEFAAQLSGMLSIGCTAVFLGNWVYRSESDPTASIVAAAVGVECSVVERAVVTPDEYARVWVDDDEARATRWANALREAGVLAIGTGIVTLRA